AAQAVAVVQQHRRNENDGDILEARVLTDHCGELETVQIRHADVDQDNCKIVLEQKLQGLFRGGSLKKLGVEPAENNLIAEELGRLIVDEEQVYLAVLCHDRSQRCSHIRSAE